MKSAPKLRCFVAMAIGQGDTDKMFFRVRTYLRSIGIDARRVDQVEHNNNIDGQILKELDACDLVWADLTYARPSVYFEAGYAERRPVPVVYTCRRDHLSPHASDAFG